MNGVNVNELLAATGNVVAEIVKWSLLGVFLGLLVGNLAFFLFRRLGWYGQGAGPGRWFRVVLCMATLVVFAVLGGIMGYAEGTKRGAERGLRESPLGEKVLPQVGEVCADLLALLHQLAMPE